MFCSHKNDGDFRDRIDPRLLFSMHIIFALIFIY